MPSIKIGFICGGNQLPELLSRFGRFHFVTVAGMYDVSGHDHELTAAGCGVSLFGSIEDLLGQQGLQFVVEAVETGNSGIISNYYRPFGVIAVKPDVLEKLLELIGDHRELMQLFQDKELMEITLNNVQEGIEFCDRDGTLRYVNPAYTRITGIDPRERIGTNVFEMSRDGALVRALTTKAPVFGLRNRAKYSKAEVVSNAAPVFDGGELTGAVVVFQDISDIMKLTQELKQSNKIIADLSDRLELFQRAKHCFDDIIGVSEKILSLKATALKMAQSDSTVLIQGESGTGKELFAHAIHNASKRAKQPFIEINCATIPENLLESELFGHERGAFTGADKQKPGRFEMAGGGTIFLDEIGELKQEIQAKLLRVLQNKEFERVGGTRTIKADVRVIAATNKDIRKMVSRGEFREDLFFRLHVLHLVIPPLRERVEDIPALATHLLKKIGSRLGFYKKGISAEALKFLQEYSWPGNVRELENLLERVLFYEEGDYISLNNLSMHLEPFINSTTPPGGPLVTTLEQAEAQAIKKALDYYGRSLEDKRNACRALGISLASLYNKLKKYKIE
ncbi:MAG: sigma-54 interaction domain-containing protein [Bacillota bacterium]